MECLKFILTIYINLSQSNGYSQDKADDSESLLKIAQTIRDTPEISLWKTIRSSKLEFIEIVFKALTTIFYLLLNNVTVAVFSCRGSALL